MGPNVVQSMVQTEQSILPVKYAQMRDTTELTVS